VNELWRILKGHRPRFALIGVIEASTSGIEALVHPLLLKALFDQAVLARNFGRFLDLGAFYLTLGITLNLGSYWSSRWQKKFENAFVLTLQSELLDCALGLDSRQLTRAGAASFTSRIHNDVHEGVLPAIDTSITVAKQATASAAFVGVLLYLSWQASLILLLIVPPLVLVSNRIAKKIEDNTEPEREAEAQYINKLTRTLESFHAIRGLSLLLPSVRETNKAALRGFLGITFVNYRLGLKQQTISDLTMNLSDTISMIIGAWFVFAGRMSFGGFLAFVNSLWRAVTGIFNIINTIPQFRRNSAVLMRIQRLRGSQTTPYHDSGPMVIVHGAQVTYGDGTVVAIDDFELRNDEHVLLRGPNGCGKTTLLHIIAGTLAPDAGVVTLPKRVASLTAPVQLPPLQVSTLITDKSVRASMGLGGLLNHLPTDLSSGQRQRAAVAALVCEEADVYLADEPFANLDAAGRELVLRTLKQRTQGRSLLVVHHGDEELDGEFDRVVMLSGARTTVPK
jgi:ABC-type bacteriocin/lantibiotic exporter with double-glycine peptidase domain